MRLVFDIIVVIVGYLLGSIPFGLLIVKLKTGQDVRDVESGRTGGTNVMRAAGLPSGVATAVLDILKGAASVWIAQAVTPNVWLHVLAPLAAVIGHNYSIFLAERTETGGIRLRGGAGGAACFGGALGLWPYSILIILPVGYLVFFGVGYASVTTMSIALVATIIFAVRAGLGYGPWAYVVYGVIAEALLMWALRPNIKRLLDRTERLHGWRAQGSEPADCGQEDAQG
ncbi:MAG: glycerol-3-phosphate acyltransferase [Anaerolineales bacterium]|nr:glycerol-3-phosphate acyltransferase [Anaerolineales bacterium]